MIQRIQTLFLLTVFIIAVLIIFLPFQLVTIQNESYILSLLPGANADILSSSLYVPLVLNGLVISISLWSVFSFKNRRLQIRLANLLAALNVFLVGLFFLLTYTKVEATVSYEWPSFLPLISVIAAMAAAYYTKKDDELVRSADRIR